MTRHKQPRELAELKGAVAKNPQRYRGQDADCKLPLGEAPEYMSEEAKAVWFELETYALTGVLTGAHRMVLELTATLVAEFRGDPSAFAVGKYGQLISCLARLGLTPADQQKVVVDKNQDKANPYESLEQ